MYLVGILIGTGVVAMFYGNRACSFLPEKQVLLSIRSSDMELTARTQCYLECYGIGEAELFGMIEDGNADVLFSESEPRETPKMYMVQGKSDQPFKLSFLLTDTTARLGEFIQMVNLGGDGDCDCASLDDQVIVAVWHHNDRILYELDARNIVMNASTESALNEFGIDKMEVYEVFEGATVLYNESLPQRDPEPRYVITGTIKDVSLKMTFDLGKNTTLVRVTQYQDPT